MKKSISFFILVIVTTTCFAQSWQDTVALIENAMSRFKPLNPGCQLSIKRNGEIIYSKAWGMADLEHNIPLTLTSVIEAGSVSKQFTAAAILLLAQEGKLSLDDDVRKYIPELPGYGETIKLEQMIHHTSGLRDWGSIAAISGWPRGTKTYRNDDALEIISKQKELNNVPGAEFIYSNSNYNLLAIIVQRVSGLSLAEFTRKNIFVPAGMTHTEWRDNHNRIVPNRAIAYALTGNGYETEMPNEDVYGNGGLLTTTEDLLKWNDFYQQGKMGTSSLLSKQTTVAPFNNGVMNEYGAGLFIQKLMGWKYINHGGATAGYRANLGVFPDLNLSIAFLSNTSQFDTSKTNLNRAIINLFVTNKEGKQTINKNEAKIQLSEARLKNYTGWYRNERDGSGIQITLKDKNLLMDNKSQLIPQTESQFKFETGDRLIDMKDNKRLLFILPEKDTIAFTKVDSAPVSADDFTAYEGKYFSAETNSTITVFQKNGMLMIHLKPNEDHQLMPTYNDAFTITDFGGTLYFIKNKKNKITAFGISISRARNVAFEKLK